MIWQVPMPMVIMIHRSPAMRAVTKIFLKLFHRMSNDIAKQVSLDISDSDDDGDNTIQFVSDSEVKMIRTLQPSQQQGTQPYRKQINVSKPIAKKPQRNKPKKPSRVKQMLKMIKRQKIHFRI